MSNEKKLKDAFSGKMEPTKTQKVSNKNQTVQIMFKETRKFDLHIGRDMITFMGREYKSIPKEWIRHRDFKQVQYLFIIKGV